MATRAALQRADNAGVRSSQGSLAKTPAVAQRFAPLTQNLLQRKASCACGGSCPRCQAKSTLTISQPNDPAEREKPMRLRIESCRCRFLKPFH